MCTGIKLENRDNLILAHNYDTPQAVGYIFANQRGITKYAFGFEKEQALHWTSKYGSVTFNQAGKEFPCEGMNESGLVVAQNALPQSRFPESGGRPRVSETQLIQYLLDTCATTAQALDSLEKVDVVQSIAPMQYILMDSQGDMAVIQYLEGQARVYRHGELPLPIAANSAYEDSMLYSGGDRTRYKGDSPYGRNSLLRFEKAVEKLKGVPGDGDLLEYAFGALDACAREDNAWQIIYVPREKAIYFRTRECRNLKHIVLNELRLGRGSSSDYYWMDKPIQGNVSQRFTAYTHEINRELVYFFFRNPLTRQQTDLNPGDEELDARAAYPGSFVP